MAPRLWVLTGTPGTGVRKSLSKFVEHCKKNGGRIEWRSIDDPLKKLAAPHVKRLFGLPDESAIGPLLLPRAFLRELWRQALQKTFDGEAGLPGVDSLLGGGSDVLLTFHLCYFHHGTREYLVPADFDAFSERLAGRATCVITLIDDIYDSHNRLSRGGGVFNPPRSADEAMIDALTVLTWRSNEMLVSDSLARVCKLPHFVFAVKHPVDTFHDVLYSEKQKVYLSHPITEPREMARTRGVAEARLAVEELNRVLARLQSRCVVLEPTSIDEQRFVPTQENRKIFKGNLDHRWPFVEDRRHLLYVPPASPSGTWRFPWGWNQDQRPPIERSPLTEALQNAIAKQINARDHTLVEQSDYVVAWRPICDGHESGGVKEELEHVSRLITLGCRAPSAVVYCPPEDRKKFPSRYLWEQAIPAWRRSNLVMGDEQDFKKLEAALQSEAVPQLAEVLRGNSNALIQMTEDFGLRIIPQPDTKLARGTLGPTEVAHRDDAASGISQDFVKDVTPYLDKLRKEGHSIEFENEKLFFDRLQC